MSEQLISYETAKLAKEKGFDERCYNYYIAIYTKGKYHLTCGVEYDSDAKVKFDWNNNNEFSSGVKSPYPNTYYPSQCSAPSQSTLQKWLRDKHGISVLVHLDITLSYVYVINSLHPKASYVGKEINSKHVYSLYEQALEEGLKTALNLIQTN